MGLRLATMRHHYWMSSTLCWYLSIYPDTTVHGQEGPVAVSYPVYLYPQYRQRQPPFPPQPRRDDANAWSNGPENFLEGMRKLGYPVDGDLNDGLAVGASVIPSDLSAWNQSRFDARTAYYDPVMARPNLHLLTGHTVTRILHNTTTAHPHRSSAMTGASGGILMTGVEVSPPFATSYCSFHLLSMPMSAVCRRRQ